MNEREQLAKDNGMTIEFVNWFFDNKKDGCGNAWFIMMAAMWEGWSGREAKCAALAAESEDRRQFILNGVEFGFIRLPDKYTRDPATATYERCMNSFQTATCPKCNGTGMADSGGTQPWGEPIEIECDCRQQDANTAELVASGIITKVGE